LLRRYLAAILIGNLGWEFAQLPLYTIWQKGTAGEIAFAALHCTAGDVLIAGSAVLAAVVIAGGGRWPNARYRLVGAITVLAGLAAREGTTIHRRSG
jgi:hypothetical protein